MSSLEVVSHKKKRKQDDAVAVTADADIIESTVSEKKHKKSKKSASDVIHDEQKATVEVVPVQKASKKAVSANESDPATAAAAVASVEDDLTPAQYRKKHEITVLGNDLEKIGIFMKFSDAPFPGPLQKTLIGAGFTAPSAIQAQAWPVAFAMRDCLAIAKTGSGKTLGFLLPTFSRILNSSDKTSKQPRMLVMSPTRELALQTAEQCVKFGRAIGIRATTIYGGAPKGPQIRDLTSGVHVVIGTPGRICDLMNFNGFDGKPVLKLGEVSTLVLDEADRMLDMGFEPSIREIVAMLPAERQTLFFTATWPKAVERIAYELLRENTVQINIGNAHEELVANKDVKQIVEVVDASDKFDKLTKTLAGADPAAPIIIFCNMKVRVQEIADQLWQSGASIDAIHGDKSQAEREYILKQFKRGDIKILVATDVAARGLDIKGVDLVVNYDFPRVVDDYVHRIGRTGRAGATGTAVTFFDPALDKAHAKELIKVMKDAGSDVPAALQALMPRSNGWGGGGGGRGGFRGGRGGGYGGRGGGGSGYGGRGGGRGGGGRGRW